VGLIAGPLLAVALGFGTDLVPGNPVVTRAAAVAVWMAVWWITEAIPIPATALLPVALFPALGIMSGRTVAATYFNNVIFLFIGGFIMALAMERWHLHRRIALRIVLWMGAGPRRLLLGFMLATAFLSMWISNTACAMMMVPIALAVIHRFKETAGHSDRARSGVGLLIGIAYAASIGGLATLIGTPPNLAFTRIFAITFPDAPAVTFAGWIGFGLPASIVLLAAAWLVISRLFMRGDSGGTLDRSAIVEEYRALGRPSYEEIVVLVGFVLLAMLWLFRADIAAGPVHIPGWSRLLPGAGLIDDGTVAIAVALALFLWPARSKPGQRLMNWETASRLHWGIVILFGGGFALAAGFESSGLSTWVAERMQGLAGLPPWIMVAAVCCLLTFLTELTSNTATTQMVLPLLASLAVAIEVHPLLLMIPATLSASCAFMLPVATPPNAIVFGSGEVRMADMMRAGIIMNLIGVVLITALMYLLGLSVFGIDPGVLPAWARF
jgi:sodium-dependent dicarboxylate transporter 2/3/5